MYIYSAMFYTILIAFFYIFIILKITDDMYKTYNFNQSVLINQC